MLDCIIHKKINLTSKLPTVEANRFQVSSFSTAWYNFTLTACISSMTWGGLAHYNLDVAGEMATMGREAMIWEEDDSVMSSD
jgi:hypothetical protein